MNVNTAPRTFSIIGTSVHRLDGVDEVTGKAKNAADLLRQVLGETKSSLKP
ncbi:MAG: hypothetical protein ACM37Z_16960 [Deltaproteobacteria bacterium]